MGNIPDWAQAETPDWALDSITQPQKSVSLNGSTIAGGPPQAGGNWQATSEQLSESPFGIGPDMVPAGKGPIMAPLSAMAKGAAGLGQFLTSPLGMVQTGAAVLPGIGIVQRLKFLYDMGAGALDSGKNLFTLAKKIADDPAHATDADVQAVDDNIVGVATSMFMAGKMGEHEFTAVTGKPVPSFGGKPNPVQGPLQTGVNLNSPAGAKPPTLPVETPALKPVQTVPPPVKTPPISPQTPLSTIGDALGGKLDALKATLPAESVPDWAIEPPKTAQAASEAPDGVEKAKAPAEAPKAKQGVLNAVPDLSNPAWVIQAVNPDLEFPSKPPSEPEASPTVSNPSPSPSAKAPVEGAAPTKVTLYHGSKFGVKGDFDTESENVNLGDQFGHGVYTSHNPEVAKNYAGQSGKVYGHEVTLQKPFEHNAIISKADIAKIADEVQKSTGQKSSFLAAIAKDNDYSGKAFTGNRVHTELSNRVDKDGTQKTSTEILKKVGFDSYVMPSLESLKDPSSESEVVLFDPKSFKSEAPTQPPAPVSAAPVEAKPKGWTDERWQIFQKQKQAGIDAQKERDANYFPPVSKQPVSAFKVGDKVIHDGIEKTVTRLSPNPERVILGKRSVPVKEVKPVAEPTEIGPGMVDLGASTPEMHGKHPQTMGAGEDIHGVAQRVRDARAAAGVASPVPIGEGWNLKEAVDWGRQLKREGADPEKALVEFEKTGSISPDAAALTRAHGEDLAKAARNIEEKFGTNSEEYKVAQKASDQWEQRTKPIGTAWHKIGIAHQGETELDTGNVLEMARAHKKATGRDFTPEQMEKATKLAEDSKKSAQEAQDALKKVQDELSKAQQPKYPSHIINVAERIVARLDTAADSARARMKARLGRVSAGLDPTMLSDAAIIGASHIAHIGLDFAKWSKAMTEELGEVIKPNLDDIFKVSQKQIDGLGDSMGGKDAETVKQAVKKTPAKATTPRQSALDAQKKALEKSIEEKQRKLDEGDIHGKPKPVNRPSHPELEELKQKRDDLNDQLAKARKDAERNKPDAQKAAERLEKQVRDINGKIAEQESKIATGDLSKSPKAGKVNRPLPPELEQAKQKLEQVNRELEELRKEAESKPKTDTERVWDAAKKEIKAGAQDMGELRQKLAISLGMTPREVAEHLNKNVQAKRATDEMYLKQARARQLKGNAKRWLKDQQSPLYERYIAKIPRALFAAKVFGHATVGIGTHAAQNLFIPSRWPAIARAYVDMWKFAWGKPALHEAAMEDLVQRPNFAVAKRAGLVNDPFTSAGDYQSPETVKWARMMGAGNRAFDALKEMRQDLFDLHWNKLPAHMKTPEVAQAIADLMNHATGSTRRAVNESNWKSLLFFAPRLVGSRLAWEIADPVKAIRYGLKGKLATPAERHFAMSQLKEKAAFVGIYLSALVVNQGILMATGSKQKVNMSDPSKSDWLRFKGEGYAVAPFSPGVFAIRQLARVLHDLVGTRTKFEKLEGTRQAEAAGHLAQYARGELSPTAGDVTDQVTRQDFMGRNLPDSDEKDTKWMREHGYGRYTWPEYLAQTLTPIPFEEPVKEVWKHWGTSVETAGFWMRILLEAGARAATGINVSEDQGYGNK